jgi:DNA-binding NarL/FixJ family response regulator
MPNDRIRILVADDHPVVRDGLIAVLGTQPDLEVIGEAANGDEVVEKSQALKPDVILLDLEMPGPGGVETVRRLHDTLPDVRLLIFTAFDRDEQIVESLRAGASGYLLKGAPRQELFRAVRVVHEGGSLLEPVVATKLLERVRSPASPLSPRELEVLRNVAQGTSNREIGTRLFISERTVKFHVSSIIAKLGAANRTAAVAIARSRGLIDN